MDFFSAFVCYENEHAFACLCSFINSVKEWFMNEHNQAKSLKPVKSNVINNVLDPKSY